MSVKVAVRSRPLSDGELSRNAKIIVRMNGSRVELLDTAEGGYAIFAYDQALWSSGPLIKGSTNAEATQEAVYEVVGAELLEHILTGYNGCIFAYGQTGSGKTYCMSGPEDNPGIIPRIAQRLFEKVDVLQKSGKEAYVEVSFYEVYNEKVRCLLHPSAEGYEASHLRVREHPTFGPFIEGLGKFVVASQEDFLKLMCDGNKVRVTAVTAMNAASSRSHAVFTITLTQKQTKGNLVITKTSRLNLVDLAGSERASKSMSTGRRLAEGVNINKSLTCLGNVISALAEVQETGRARHIPYRDSVLTWILKDNLGGNSKTVMLATISPSSEQYFETMSTLRYAERAKKIVNNAIVNESNSSEVIAALQKEIEALRLQLTNASVKERSRLQDELAASEAVKREFDSTLEDKYAETRRMMDEREQYMHALEEELAAHKNEIEFLKNANAEKERRIEDLLRRIELHSKNSGSTPETPEVEIMREQVAALEQQQQLAQSQNSRHRQHAVNGTSTAADGRRTSDIREDAESIDEDVMLSERSASSRADSALELQDELHFNSKDSVTNGTDTNDSNPYDSNGALQVVDMDIDETLIALSAHKDSSDADEDVRLDSADESESIPGHEVPTTSAPLVSSAAEEGSALEFDHDIAFDEEEAEEDEIHLSDEEEKTTEIHQEEHKGREAADESHDAVVTPEAGADDVQPTFISDDMPDADEELDMTARNDSAAAGDGGSTGATPARDNFPPDIIPPSQEVPTLVMPSHALPHNRHLRESFGVVELKNTFLDRKKERTWTVDVCGGLFIILDRDGRELRALQTSNLFRVEADAASSRRLTLYFFDSIYPFKLEFDNTSRKHLFFQLAMLLRRHSISWCPSLCLEKVNDVIINVHGTTISSPGGPDSKVRGDCKFMVARMPYEVIDFWYGCFSLRNQPLPQNPAVLSSFIPKNAHEVYIIGITDVPASVIGHDALGQYFLTYLGASSFFVLASTAVSSTPRYVNNAMVIICRRSFIVRISNIEVVEAVPVRAERGAKNNFTAVGCAIKINEASLGVVLINAKHSPCSTQARTACVRTLTSKFSFGNAAVDMYSRFDYLIVSGDFGFDAAFAPEDVLLKQQKVDNLMSNMVESEASDTLKMAHEPMRIFYSARPHVARMDVNRYTTSRAVASSNAFISADLFCRRPFLSAFGEPARRTQLLLSDLRISGDRLPAIARPRLLLFADFLEGSPVAGTLQSEGATYVAPGVSLPALYPCLNHPEYLRLQVLVFSLSGYLTSSPRGKRVVVASGVLPLKHTLRLGETTLCAVPLLYRGCLVAKLSAHLTQTYTAVGGKQQAIANHQLRQFMAYQWGYENEVLNETGAWAPAAFTEHCIHHFSSDDPHEERNPDALELPDTERWSWLEEQQHGADSSAWMYADGIGQAFTKHASALSTIRRRPWRRAMHTSDPLTLHRYLASHEYPHFDEDC